MVVKPSLAHDASEEAFGEAVSRCQGYTPECSRLGQCQFDGYCFSTSAGGFKRARKKIADLIESETQDVHTRVWLKLALDALDDRQFLERGTLDVKRLLTIQKEVRVRYGEPRCKD